MLSFIMPFLLRGLGLIKSVFSAVLDIAARYPSQAILIALIAAISWNLHHTRQIAADWRKTAYMWKTAHILTKENYVKASERAQTMAEAYKMDVEIKHKEIQYAQDASIRNLINTALDGLRKERAASALASGSENFGLSGVTGTSRNTEGRNLVAELDEEICTINTLKLLGWKSWWDRIKAETPDQELSIITDGKL